VELEIQASPDTVGAPITILQVDKNGPSWISNDSGCPTLLTPEQSWLTGRAATAPRTAQKSNWRDRFQYPLFR